MVFFVFRGRCATLHALFIHVVDTGGYYDASDDMQCALCIIFAYSIPMNETNMCDYHIHSMIPMFSSICVERINSWFNQKQDFHSMERVWLFFFLFEKRKKKIQSNLLRSNQTDESFQINFKWDSELSNGVRDSECHGHCFAASLVCVCMFCLLEFVYLFSPCTLHRVLALAKRNCRQYCSIHASRRCTLFVSHLQPIKNFILFMCMIAFGSSVSVS